MKNKIFIISIAIALMAAAGIFLVKSDTLFAKEKWRVTQYGVRDFNSSFYTIYNSEKGLIVIDGGWNEDEDYVRKVIASLGNKVDAWILTHPHNDHIDAFNNIYKDPQGITIGSILTAAMPSPEVCKKIAEWDTMDSYIEFLELDIPYVNYAQAGDVYDICGLEVKILSVFDDYVEKVSEHYLNDGGMMYKVSAEKDSFLFCADVGSSVSDYLLDKWGDELKADYIQMGHHGNGGLKADFYKKVNPKVAFFDAPDWLMYDQTGKYTTPQNTALMESLGCEIKSFNTAPNSVVLN